MKAFLRTGLLAVDLRWLQAGADDAPRKQTLDRSNVDAGSATIVRVIGPLAHHAVDDDCDSYDAIRARVEAACASSPGTVLLCLDSPGGQVSGCFELSQVIRARCAQAGKRLVAYVEGQASSAAYALACAAEEIVTPPSGVLGSIGVLDVRADTTALDEKMGLRFAFITSGARKADGNPHVAFSAAEYSDRQRLVDDTAAVFFVLVAQARRCDVRAISALEARVFVGATAVAAGLADRVLTKDELLASLAGGGKTMATKMQEARAALEEEAQGDGADAARARRALAAMDEEEEPTAESEDAPAAEGDGETSEDADEANDPDEAQAARSASRPAAAVSARTAGELGATASELGHRVSRLERQLDASRTAALLASRPDLAPDLSAILRSKSFAEAASIVNAIPKPKTPKPAATSTVAATRGETQYDAARADAAGDPDILRADRAMGMVATASVGVDYRDNVLTLGAPVARKGS